MNLPRGPKPGPSPIPGTIGEWLAVTCTCERAIVTATPQQIRDGTPITCGQPTCHGQPPPGQPPRQGGHPQGTAPHGTQAGYSRHFRQGTTPCQACKTAHTNWRNRRQKGTR